MKTIDKFFICVCAKFHDFILLLGKYCLFQKSDLLLGNREVIKTTNSKSCSYRPIVTQSKTVTTAVPYNNNYRVTRALSRCTAQLAPPNLTATMEPHPLQRASSPAHQPCIRCSRIRSIVADIVVPEVAY